MKVEKERKSIMLKILILCIVSFCCILLSVNTPDTVIEIFGRDFHKQEGELSKQFDALGLKEVNVLEVEGKEVLKASSFNNLLDKDYFGSLQESSKSGYYLIDSINKETNIQVVKVDYLDFQREDAWLIDNKGNTRLSELMEELHVLRSQYEKDYHKEFIYFNVFLLVVIALCLVYSFYLGSRINLLYLGD